MSVPLELPELLDGARLVPEPALAPATERSAAVRWPSPVLPTALTALVIGAALAGWAPLRVAAGAPVPARLELPAAYVALAPLCDGLDALSLLSVRQHVAVLTTTLAAYALWRWLRRRGAGPRGRPSMVREIAGAAVMLAVLVSVYAFGALAPRPMAALRALDQDALVVDFHSHTNASWDARRDFTPERNRAWHAAAGFDAAYVSDHGTLAGALAGERANPAFAGDGTVLLRAVESRCGEQHVVVLGPAARAGPTGCGPAVGATEATDTPITLLTLPTRLPTAATLPVVQAIEGADGAPRALDQIRRDSAALVRLADAGDLAIVTGSNNHGWGRTASAWSVMVVPGWRAMGPAALDVAIRRQLSGERRHAVTIVERRRAVPAVSPLRLVGTVPELAWTTLASLSPAERAAWVGWAWSGWALVLVARRARSARRGRRRREAEPAVHPARSRSGCERGAA